MIKKTIWARKNKQFVIQENWQFSICFSSDKKSQQSLTVLVFLTIISLGGVGVGVGVGVWLFSGVFGGVTGKETPFGPSNDLRPGDDNDAVVAENLDVAATIWLSNDTLAPSLVITTLMGIFGGFGSVRQLVVVVTEVGGAGTVVNTIFWKKQKN